MAAIVEQPKGFDLAWRQVGRDVDRDLHQPKLLCRQQAHVARDDDPFGVHDDWLLPAEFFQAGGDLVDCPNAGSYGRCARRGIKRSIAHCTIFMAKSSE